MADQAEVAFLKATINSLSGCTVHYPNDYQAPPRETLKKLPVVQVDLPPPPQPKASTSTAAASETIKITFKSLKPSATFSLPVSTTDTVAFVKEQLASQPNGPSVDIQRLLLKGKALVDSKLLKDYAMTDGATVNLMIKPGAKWDPTATPAPTIAAPKPVSSGHARTPSGNIPAVTISPTPDNGNSPRGGLLTPSTGIPLSLDNTAGVPPSSSATATAFQETITSPDFWERFHIFLRSEFISREDAAAAFEDFLLASKNHLSDIARIRDAVGVTGMAGT